MITLTAILTGFILDLLLGDPPRCPHLVVGMGKLIAALERVLRRLLPTTPRGELLGGAILALALPLLWGGAAWAALHLCGLVHPLLRWGLESLLIWQCLALRSLSQAGADIHKALDQGNIGLARAAVGRIVGRDTALLDEAGIIRAGVESLSENASDGVIAPLFWLALGGAPLGVAYKAVNTLDSMVGYRNQRYLYFGRASARLDDAANFIPARLSGLLLVLSAPWAGLAAREAWRILKRDRLKHASPNSAHGEAAVAGALGIQLGGDAYYGGVLAKKPLLGDDLRLPESADIGRVRRLVAVAGCLSLLLTLCVRGLLLWL